MIVKVRILKISNISNIYTLLFCDTFVLTLKIERYSVLILANLITRPNILFGAVKRCNYRFNSQVLYEGTLVKYMCSYTLR